MNDFDFDYGREIAKTPRKVLEHCGGVGLAVSQIGTPQRVFVVNISPNSNYHLDLPQIGLKAYANPEEILAVSSKTNYMT